MKITFKLLTNTSLLETMNPLTLFIVVILFTVSGFLAATIYKNTNDFKKTFYTAIGFGVLLVIGCMIWTDLPIWIMVLLIPYNIVISAFVSNYYFYH